MQLMRIFAFVNGYGWNGTRNGEKGQPTPYPAQPTPGVFNETTLQRFDFVMDQLAQVGRRKCSSLIAVLPVGMERREMQMRSV